MTRYLTIAITGFAVSLSLTYLLEKFSLKGKLLLSKEGLPLAGGIAIGLAFAAAYFYGGGSVSSGGYPVKALFIPAALMLFFGILDDWQELSIATKLLSQLVAASLLFILGIKTQIVFLGAAGNLIVTLLWVIGMTNAFNHLDVIDGLAAGVALIASASFLLLAVFNADTQSAYVSLALFSAIPGFFLYNFPPARIYMGNSGSHLLGFLLAAVALSISYAPSGKEAALLSPLLILGLPILDTAFLIVVRLMKKSIPFRKSNDHPAIRLLFMGQSKKGALLSMLCASFFFCLCGILLVRLPNSAGLSLAFFALVIALSASFMVAKVDIDK